MVVKKHQVSGEGKGNLQLKQEGLILREGRNNYPIDIYKTKLAQLLRNNR